MVVSGVLQLMVYGMLLAAVYKVFALAGDISEIKEILKGFKRTTDLSSLATAIATESKGGIQPSPAAPPDLEDVLAEADRAARVPEVVRER